MLTMNDRGRDCQPWEVKDIPGAGRGLVARRKVIAGEVVVRDWPLVQGPLPGTGVCVVCLQGGDDDVLPCVSCGMPVCKSRAKGCGKQHKSECEVLSRRGNDDDLTEENMYTVLAVLRLVVQLERDPGVRTQVEHLMDHREELQGDLVNQKIVKFIASQDHTEDIVWRSLGMLHTNGVTSLSVGGVATAHGLYPVFSITNHSCVANTRHGKEGEAFCLVAVVDIEKGQEITTNYKSSSLGNIVRRIAIKQAWYFDCNCPRCSDPTELGTYSSALRCKLTPKCKGYFLPTNSLDYVSQWKCDKCGKYIESEDAVKKTNKVQDIYESGRGGIDELEKTLHDILDHVHSRHYIAMQVKRMLMLMYGNCATHRLDKMTKKQLKRKADLCKEYITIFSELEPGLTKWKGRVTEELARTLVKLEGKSNVEVLKLLGEAGKCRKLDSQQEQAAFNMRMANMMSG